MESTKTPDTEFFHHGLVLKHCLTFKNVNIELRICEDQGILEGTMTPDDTEHFYHSLVFKHCLTFTPFDIKFHI